MRRSSSLICLADSSAWINATQKSMRETDCLLNCQSSSRLRSAAFCTGLNAATEREQSDPLAYDKALIARGLKVYGEDTLTPVMSYEGSLKTYPHVVF